MVKESDFRYQESPIPELTDGQFLVRVLYVAFEPAMRGWMEDRASYIPPIQLGEVMRGVSVGQVIESKHPAFQLGDCVTGGYGWQEYAVTNGRGGLMPTTLIPREVPLTMPLSVLGITGLEGQGQDELFAILAGERRAARGSERRDQSRHGHRAQQRRHVDEPVRDRLRRP